MSWGLSQVNFIYKVWLKLYYGYHKKEEISIQIKKEHHCLFQGHASSNDSEIASGQNREPLYLIHKPLFQIHWLPCYQTHKEFLMSICSAQLINCLGSFYCAYRRLTSG